MTTQLESSHKFRRVGQSTQKLKPFCCRTIVMAGSQVGRVHKGHRRPVTIRVPEEHYAHYKRHAEMLRVPVSDYVSYRIAVADDLGIPVEVLTAHPGLLDLLHPYRRTEVLYEHPHLAVKYKAMFGRDVLPGMPRAS